MKPLVCELLGTFALVFAGTGAIVVNDESGGALTHVGVSLTFGLVVLAMICAIGEISGAHLNPAVTIGFWAAGRISGERVAPYVASQCAGAILASGVLRLLFPLHASLGATVPAGDANQSFVLELILSFLLMFVILSVSSAGKEKGISCAIAVGSVIALEALFGGPISGASMNPARSLAPALVTFRFEHLWLYLAAPALGALLAVACCRYTQPEGCCVPAKEPLA